MTPKPTQRRVTRKGAGLKPGLYKARRKRRQAAALQERAGWKPGATEGEGDLYGLHNSAEW